MVDIELKEELEKVKVDQVVVVYNLPHQYCSASVLAGENCWFHLPNGMCDRDQFMSSCPDGLLEYHDYIDDKTLNSLLFIYWNQTLSQIFSQILILKHV